MRFSIVIPTHNRAYILKRPIESVLAQTASDWELIVVDDGSTDDTKAVVESFADPRIGYVRQQNAGPSAARNNGMNRAKGDIVVYLDSDDRMTQDALETMAASDGTYGTCNHDRIFVMLNADGSVHTEKSEGPNASAATLQDYYDWKVKTTSSGLFHKRSFVPNITWRDVLIEDLEILLQMAVLDEAGFRYVQKPVIEYKQAYGGDGLVSRATYGDFGRAFGQIYDWHKTDPLMKNPDVYLSRVVKYAELQKHVEAGLTPPPRYKYFPELWNGKP